MNETQNDTTGLIERMTSVGAQYGYRKSRRHPSVSPFIYGVKNRTEVFDLEKIMASLEDAKAFVRTLAKEGKMLLFVGGKPEAREVVRQGAQTLGQPYAGIRWIGGTLTNYSEVKKRIKRLLTLREDRDSGGFGKYTKLERLNLDREITRLGDRFGGLVAMAERLPDALFVVDPRYEHTAVKEARDLFLPVVALLNSDCDAALVNYPIAANDATVASITLFLNEIVGAYREGAHEREKAGSVPRATEAVAE